VSTLTAEKPWVVREQQPISEYTLCREQLAHTYPHSMATDVDVLRFMMRDVDVDVERGNGFSDQSAYHGMSHHQRNAIPTR